MTLESRILAGITALVLTLVALLLWALAVVLSPDNPTDQPSPWYFNNVSERTTDT